MFCTSENRLGGSRQRLTRAIGFPKKNTEMHPTHPLFQQNYQKPPLTPKNGQLLVNTPPDSLHFCYNKTQLVDSRQTFGVQKFVRFELQNINRCGWELSSCAV
jgi:hypothetical protein